ncbi:MAG: tyrosine-protein phosphatase [Porphyromonas sp.]|nr:tyrosine-protein phosphatase [Porphyromonas sp.]
MKRATTERPQQGTIARGALTAVLLLLLFSCAKQPYYIDTITQQDREGNYRIRWDVQPSMEGNVEIFVSNDAFATSWQPFVIEAIRKETTTYTSHDLIEQTYFLMVFDGQETRVTSTRVIPTAGPVNLRDIGGYMTDSGQQMRWGMIYRSGDLSRIQREDEPLISRMRIKNHLSLASAYGQPRRSSSQIPYAKFATIEPDVYVDFNGFQEKIYSGKVDAESVVYFYNDLFNSIAFESTHQISSVLHFLLEPEHYPILISDDLGNTRVAFITMLIQNILGVSRSDIINDYLLSNALLPVNQLEPHGFFLTTAIQETLTEYYRSRPNDLHSVTSAIEHNYGSISKYLEEVLDFDKADQARLRSILLYRQ